MENILKKGHYRVIIQFDSIQAIESTTPHFHPEMQQVLDFHQRVFDKPKEIPPSWRENDHGIPLFTGAQLPNFHPYQYPFSQNNEI